MPTKPVVKSRVVIKHSGSVAMNAEITHMARKTWTVLLQEAYNELAGSEVHSVTVSDLFSRMSMTSRNYEHLRDVMRELTQTPVEWNVLGKDRRNVWTVSSMLAGARIRAGVLEYSFGPFLREVLHNPNVFARFDLQLVCSFSTRAAMTLFELAVDYTWRVAEAPRRGRIDIPLLDVEKLRGLLGYSDGQYPRWSDFRRYVLEPAIKEVREVGGIELTYETQREGRAVSHVKISGVTLREEFVFQTALPL